MLLYRVPLMPGKLGGQKSISFGFKRIPDLNEMFLDSICLLHALTHTLETCGMRFSARELEGDCNENVSERSNRWGISGDECAGWGGERLYHGHTSCAVPAAKQAAQRCAPSCGGEAKSERRDTTTAFPGLSEAAYGCAFEQTEQHGRKRTVA